MMITTDVLALTGVVIERHLRSTPIRFAEGELSRERRSVDSIGVLSKCCLQAYSSAYISLYYYLPTSVIKIPSLLFVKHQGLLLKKNGLKALRYGVFNTLRDIGLIDGFGR